MFSAVCSELQIAIVSTRPNHASLHGRLSDSDYRAMIFRSRVLGPHGADALLLFRIVGAEVWADGRPRLPEIRGLENDIAPEVGSVFVMRRLHNGGVPVESIFQLAHRPAVVAFGLRAYVLLLARPPVSAHNAAALILRQEYFGIVRMIDDVKPVAAADVAPLVVQNSTGASPAGPAPGAIVLQPSLYVIKRRTVIGVNLIKLPDRNVKDCFPVLGAVVRNRETAILSNPNAVRIFRIHPHRMIVAVDSSCDASPISTTVDRGRKPHADGVQAILVRGVDRQVAIVQSPADHYRIPRHHAEMFAAVV